MELFKIDKAVLDVLNQGISVDDETGEVLWDESTLDELLVDRETKWEAVALFYKTLMTEADALKQHEKSFAERRKTKERIAERLKGSLLHSLELAEKSKFETSQVAVSTRRSTAVEITDAESLPADYMKVKTDVTPDKTAIKKALTGGKAVPGAKLEERNNLIVK